MAVDPESFYSDRGISTEGAVNQELVALLKSVREFCGSVSREAPSMEAALATMPGMKALEQALSACEPTTSSEDLVHTGYGYLAEAASKIARIPELDATSELGTLIRHILEEGVSARWPAEGADDEHYDGGWSSLPGRIEAVEGLFSLVPNPGFEAAWVLANLRELSKDSLRWSGSRLRGDFWSFMGGRPQKCGN